MKKLIFFYYCHTANVYLKNIPDNLSVVEGEELQIHCKAFGTDPEITWSIGELNGYFIRKQRISVN